MFFNKSSFALAFVALGSIVSAHQTPACVLSVMGNTNNPADLSTICGTDAKKTETAICNSCGSGAGSALKFFANVCSAAGHEVDIPSITVTSATATGSGFATAVSTSGAKATGSSSGSGNGSGSGSGSGSSTGSGASGSSTASTALHTGAAMSDRQLSGTTLLGAAVFAGIAAWL